MYSNSTDIYLCLSYSVFVVFQFGFIRSLALCPRWWSLWRRIGQLRCFLIIDVRQVTGVSWQTGEAVVTFIRNLVTQTLARKQMVLRTIKPMKNLTHTKLASLNINLNEGKFFW